MFHDILVCSDGSDHALRAARVAGAIAKRCRSDVAVLDVFDLMGGVLPCMSEWQTYYDATEFLAYADSVQREAIERTGKVLGEAGVSHTSLRELGHPVEMIASVARRKHSDLIVVGSRGMTPMQELLLGSVAAGVVHHAPCPVLIVRGKKPTFERILVASDGSEAACRAAKAAGDLAQAFGGTLTVLNVFVPLHGYPNVSATEIDPEVYAPKLLEAVRKSTLDAVKNCCSTCEVVQEEGRPAEAIVKYAETHGDDLIVMGSRGRGAFKSLVLGSVSNRVMHYARQSVLIVH